MRSAKLTNFLTLLCSVFQLRELNSIMRAELRTPTGLRSKRLVIDIDQINFIQAYLIELIFHWMPEIMQNFTGFAAPRSVIGPENSHHLFNQSCATWSPAFSRASGRFACYYFDFCRLLVTHFHFCFTALKMRSKKLTSLICKKKLSNWL